MQEKVLIPFLRALITGFLTAGLAAALWQISQAATGWRLFWAAALAISLATWILYILQDQGGENTTRIFHQADPETTKIEVVARDPAGAFLAARFANLPISKEKMLAVARHYSSCRSFSHAAMAGPGRPLSRAEFESLRNVLMARGLAYWANEENHNQGIRLTHAGHAMLNGLVRVSKAQAHTGTQVKYWPDPTPGKDRYK